MKRNPAIRLLRALGYGLVNKVVPNEALADEAAALILEVYASDFVVHGKADASPVTLADQQAEAVILAGLRELAPGVPVVGSPTTICCPTSAPAMSKRLETMRLPGASSSSSLRVVKPLSAPWWARIITSTSWEVATILPGWLTELAIMPPTG